jgi:uncharacterized protein
MFVGTCQITLHITMSASLKDKRQVMQSLLEKLRHTFGLAAAEVATQESWQIGTIGLAIVSNSAAHAEKLLDRAVAYVERFRPDVEVGQVERDILPMDW